MNLPTKTQNAVSAHKELVQFVLDQSLSLPVDKRVRIYKALANIAGDVNQCEVLLSLASKLSEAEENCRQFIFSFAQQS